MNNFELHLKTKVLFGKGQIASIANEIPQDARVLVTYGGGSVFKNGVMDQVRAALKNVTFFEFGGIEPNPAYETLIKALPVIEKENINFLLAIGGGSVLDGTKFISVASQYYDKNNTWEIMTTHAAKVTSALPVATVLTLPATGSEMNNGAVISRRETGDKLDFSYEGVRPVFAVLDPQTTTTLPDRQTANGVIDAFVHTAEQYMTYPTGGTEITDRFSEAVFATLMQEGPKALKDPQNYEVRTNIMWAATMGLNGILSTGVPQDWTSHNIGHEITALHGVDHGRTLAMVLPAVYTYCKKEKKQKLAQFAQRVLGATGTEDQLADTAIQKTRAFFEEMGVPTHLSAYDIDESSIPIIMDKLAEHGRLNMGEHGAIGPKEAGEILRLAL